MSRAMRWAIEQTVPGFAPVGRKAVLLAYAYYADAGEQPTIEQVRRFAALSERRARGARRQLVDVGLLIEGAADVSAAGRRRRTFRPACAEDVQHAADPPVEQPRETPKAKRSAQVHRADAEDVWRYWLERLGKSGPAAKRSTGTTRKRLRKVAARLDEGYTVDQLKRAIDGCAESSWHQGQNERGRVYDDLELICRDGTKVDQFMALHGDQGTRPQQPLAEASAHAVARTTYDPNWRAR